MGGETIPVLVTGIGGGGHGEQILKALHLGKRRYRIVGTDIMAACTNRDGVDSFHVIPQAANSEYLDVLLEIAVRHQVRAVFHGSEAEMMVLARNRERFADAGIYVPVNPTAVIETCQDKARTARFLRDQGFLVPAFREVHKMEDLYEVDFLPAVVKPSIGGGGSANVFIAQTEPELRAFVSHMITSYSRFLVQQYVGTPEQEFTVGVMFGSDGALINSIAVKREINTALSVRTRVPNRSGRPDFGAALVVSSGVSQGRVGRWPEVTSRCEAIASALGPTAPVNIQCRLVEGEVLPFEINPRFSGTTSLRAMAGYNEPDVLIRRDVLGEEISPHFEYREVTILRGLREREVAI